MKRTNRPGIKLKRSKQLQQGLAMVLSPEVIVGSLKQETGQQIISYESIYKWIYGEGRKLALQRYLVRKKRKRGKRPCRKADKTGIPKRISTHDRPEVYKKQFGHWEADSVHFSGTRETVVTLYEITTQLTLGAKMPTQKTDETVDFITRLLSPFLAEARRSITFGNGKEFTNHQQLQKMLGVETFFAIRIVCGKKVASKMPTALLEEVSLKALELRISGPKGSRIVC